MTRTLALIAGASASLLAAGAHAAILDLTQPNTSIMLNGALFETADVHSAGTGVIDPFVRIQRNNFEHGYNTSASPLPFDEKAGTWTHDLLLTEVPTRIVGTGNDTIAYEFILDINQIGSGDSHYLSLDRVQIYTSPTPSQNTTDVASLGTLRYDMDTGEDSWVILDANLSTGSGGGDMHLYVPASFFADTPSNHYIYLYSAFGTHNQSNDGFEEWAITRLVPAPGPLALMTFGGLLITRRKR